MNFMPARRKLTVSDPELLLALERGSTPSEIAERHGVSDDAVRWRIRQLRRNLPAPAAARAEEVVSQTLGAFEALNANVATLYALKDACLRLLEHPEDAEALDVGPHDYDLEVITTSGGGPPVRRPLRDLLNSEDFLVSIEGRFADPRTLLLSTLTNIRQHVEVAVKLAERLHDVQEVAVFQREVLDAIAQADPDTAARIRGALHDRRTTRLALRPDPR
jgi:transposase-like protein